MYVRVDLAGSPAAVTLEEPQDCSRLNIEVTGGVDPAHLGAALGAADVGRLATTDADHAWVLIESLRSMAAGRVRAVWETDFGSMVDFAMAKGWLSEDDTAIRAHIEWSPE